MQKAIFLCVVFLGYITCTGAGQSGIDEVLILGKPFDLPCSFSSDTTLNVTWSKDGIPIDADDDDDHYVIYENNTLLVKSAKDDDAGEYTCTLEGSPRDVIPYTVKNKPRVEIMIKGKSKTVVQGDELELPCEMKGYPNPTVQWFKGEQVITEANDSRVMITVKSKADDEDRDDDDELLSILTIKGMQESDRAEYECRGSNSAGDDSAFMRVRVKDKLAALWPFLGIVAEVIVLCAIIFIYERRRSQQELEESDTDQSPETKNASDNKDKDVRQRK